VASGGNARGSDLDWEGAEQKGGLLLGGEIGAWYNKLVREWAIELSRATEENRAWVRKSAKRGTP